MSNKEYTKHFKTRPRFLTDPAFQRRMIKKLRNKDKKIEIKIKINASVAERSKATAL